MSTTSSATIARPSSAQPRGPCLSSLRSSIDQPLRLQLGDKGQDVGARLHRVHAVGGLDRLTDLVERASLTEPVPDLGARLVQAEIQPGLWVEQDRFALRVDRENVRA